MKRLHLFSTLALLTPLTAHAAAFQPTDVPADAKWVAHLDVDHLRDSGLWKLIETRLENNTDAQRQIDQIATVTGMRVPQDLHDVTLFGKVTGDDAGTVLVHANINRRQTMSMLEMNEDFGSKPAGAHDVLTWTDKGKVNFGAFFNDSTFIIAHSEEQVAGELATLDDASKAVKPQDTLAVGANDHQLLFLAINDVSILRNAGNLPFLKKLDGGWLGIDEAGDGVLINARLHSNNAATAQQTNTSLAGLVAIVGMMSSGKPDDANLALLSEAVQSAASTADGTSVAIKWPIAETVLAKLADHLVPTSEQSK